MITASWFKGVLAVTALAVVIAIFLALDPLRHYDQGPPPPESLSFERVRVQPGGFDIVVRNTGIQTAHIVQVMVDGAFWHFTQQPDGALARLHSARLSLPYPWVEGETHHLRLLTSLGSSFDHTIDVAVESPHPDAQAFAQYAVLGLFVGFIPIVIGMLFYPALRSLGPDGLDFVLALTVGLLAYLFVDMSLEGLELAHSTSAIFGGAALVLLPMALTVAGLSALAHVTRDHRKAITIAMLVAISIGLHNIGEGLAIGTSFANGELALGAFLIIGFTLHNATEGIAIVSPVAGERVSIARLLLLAMVAGLPVIAGIWIGAFAFSAHWAAVFFGIGGGAVLQVMGEIDRFRQKRRDDRRSGSRFSPTSVAGYACGVTVMYGTALIISH